ncbi:MAG: hypothetical protein KIT84_44915 [Labilithrix sp.]|nr:hypothetical protein [Labilithrix sp.]MCW5818224.1 hypothetical protein [Labilithrix sp.]
MPKLAPLLLVLFSTLVACGSDSKPQDAPALPADEIEAVPFASTKMLTTEDLSSLQPDAEDGKLVFTRAPASLADVAVGTVMVAGVSPSTPHGFLRVVTDVARSGETLTLDTAGAPPQLAYQKLHARVARPVSLDDGEPKIVTSLEPLGVGGTSERQTPVDVVLYDGDGDTKTTDDQLRIEGYFKGALTYDLSLDIDWGAIKELPSVVRECVASLAKIVRGKKPSCSITDLMPEVKVTFTVDPSVASDLRLVGQASLAFEKEFDVAVVPLTPLVLGPLVFLPRLEVIAKVEGGASASFRAGVAGHMTLTSSVTVSSKTAGNPTFSPPTIKDKGFTVEEPTVGLHAHAKANAGVRLTMPLYGTIGPYATAEGTLALEANPSKTPCWELRAGLENVIGVRITTPALPFLGHLKLVDWKTSPLAAIDEVVASGACKDPPPGASHLPPGSGPDAPALREPAFTPWSRVTDGTLASTTNVGPSQTGTVFSDLDRAIDGRWLVAGNDARSLVKMNDDGAVIWRAAFVAGEEETPLTVVRTAPARDASIALLATGAIGSSFDLLTLGQSGGVKRARSYALPYDLCATPSPRLLAADTGAGAGFSVLGECLSQGKAFVVHVDAAGDVTDARLWTLEGAGHFGPAASTRTTTSQLAVTGVLSTTSDDGMFVARLDDQANIVAIDAYAGCAESFNTSPTSLVAAASNGLTVAGGSFAQARAFVARIHEDGGVGFVTYPGMSGDSPNFVAGAIAELPTTGFVMAASTVELTGEGAAAVPGVALVGLDASGRAAWAKRYALAGRSSSFPALRLTTDGGALVSALAFGEGEAPGATWSMKAFAKDGTVTDPNVTSSAMVLDGGPADCPLRRIAIAPIVEEIAVEVTPLPVTRR